MALYIYNRENDVFEIFDDRLSDIFSLKEDGDGNLWGGGLTELVNIDRANRKHQYYHIGQFIRTITDDKHGNLWLGTEGGGLVLFNKAAKKITARYTTAQGLSNNSIFSTLEDDRGNLWLGTFNGLSKSMVSLTEEICIWGGQYFSESKVTVANSPAGANLVVGIVNLKSKELFQKKNDKEQYIYTYDRQSENSDNLGLAIAVPRDQVFNVGTTPNSNTDVRNTHYLAFPLEKATAVFFRFYSGWEQSEAYFKTRYKFDKYLKSESEKYLNKIIKY